MITQIIHEVIFKSNRRGVKTPRYGGLYSEGIHSLAK